MATLISPNYIQIGLSQLTIDNKFTGWVRSVELSRSSGLGAMPPAAFDRWSVVTKSHGLQVACCRPLSHWVEQQAFRVLLISGTQSVGRLNSTRQLSLVLNRKLISGWAHWLSQLTFYAIRLVWRTGWQERVKIYFRLFECLKAIAALPRKYRKWLLVVVLYSFLLSFVIVSSECGWGSRHGTITQSRKILRIEWKILLQRRLTW